MNSGLCLFVSCFFFRSVLDSVTLEESRSLHCIIAYTASIVHNPSKAVLSTLVNCFGNGFSDE
jgi:hypothetical protein